MIKKLFHWSLMLMMLRIVWAGLASGFLMAGFLRVVESLTQIKVYTLLLNVDYIPFFSRVTGIEWLELALHMVVAIGVSWFVATILLPRIKRTNFIVPAVIGFSLVIALLLYPSTLMSERTPAIDDAEAWLWWIAAHIIYGWALAILLQSKQTSSKE